MDPITVLDKHTQDLLNLPLEVRHLLEELKNKDNQLMEARKRYQAKDNQIHKFIRANGTLNKHPKEQQLYAKIDEDMKLVTKIQKEKILLSNTALFLISKHLYNFETDIAQLERDETLPKVDDLADFEAVSLSLNGLSDYSGTPTPRNSTVGTPGADDRGRRQKRKQMKMNGTLGGRLIKRAKLEDLKLEDPLFGSSLSLHIDHHESSFPPQGEDADNRLYCFCQSVSYGEMIGCDNDDCRYEWFHWGCVGITAPPKDDEIWYCPDCAPKMEKRKKKRKF